MTSALRAIVISPSAWVLGAAGFLARGGILLFVLPIWSIPTPVGVTLLVPPLAVDTTGVSPDFLRQLVALGALLVVLAAVALVTGALADALAYARTCGLVPDGIAGVAGMLILVELAVLLPAIAASIVAAGRLIDVGEAEYLLPSSTAVPYVVRVVNGAWPQLLAVGGCLVVADVANALLSRVVLRRALAPPVVPSPRASIGRRVARAAAAWLGGWAATLLFVLPGLAAIELVWPVVRDQYAATLRSSPPSAAALVAVTALFIATWIGGVLVAGLGSAIRTAGWTFATLA